MSLPGDSWRWNTLRHELPRVPTVSVIEPATARTDPPKARRLPFGFGPRDQEIEKAAHSEANCELHPSDTTEGGW